MTIFTFIETIAYYLCICMALYYVRDCAIRNKMFFVIFPIIYSIISFLIFLTINDTINIISFSIIILFLLSPKLVFKNSKTITILSLFLIMYLLDIIVSSTIIFVLGQSTSLLFKTILSFILNLMLTLAISITIKSKHFKIQQYFNLISKKVKTISLLSLITSAFLLTLISESANFTNTSKWYLVFRIIISLFIICVGAIFPILNINSFAKNYYIKQSKNLENQIQTQVEYYTALAKSNYDLRQFQHNFNNLKIGISGLIKDGKIEEALKMLNYCDNQLLSATNICKFDTGNNIVDALLADKQIRAAAFNTQIHFTGAISNKINPSDLCVIFGNALDNAIESCEKVISTENKTIQIQCKCRGGFMFLNMTNPVQKDIPIYKNSIPTSKDEKSLHGFGLYSINQIVKKYDGTLTLSCQNNEFSINIEFYFL